MPKRSLRHQLLARRKALSVAEVEAMSEVIQKTFMASREFAEAKIIALYAAAHNEVDTAAVLKQSLADGKSVLLPTVCGDGLDFRQISGLASLHGGAFGILEPDSSCTVRIPQEADVIVVPGVAFDLMGRRVGYGKGYYDRVLHTLEGFGKLVGFCYEMQLVTDISAEPHDVKMDMIITEKQVVRPRDPRD
jgi:5-formyltetrahydrofolate cyclo-ligase